MRLRFGDRDRAGRALDCRGVGLAPEAVAAAVRDPADDRVRCPRAAAVHEHVGLVAEASTVDRRALATVALSRGHRPPALDRLAEVRDALASHEAAGPDVSAARERVAATAGERERLRERVAELRGEVQARRDAGLEAGDARERLREAARALSEAGTEASAAREQLARERERARARYDARERRFALEDRAANLAREARAELATAVRPAVEAALADLTDAGVDEAPGHLCTLAAARVAVLAAPVVVAAGPFDATEAAAWLGAPVVRL